jgi:hypothetical protein
VSLSPSGLNVGHATGLVVGLATAALDRGCADVTVVGPRDGSPGE